MFSNAYCNWSVIRLVAQVCCDVFSLALAVMCQFQFSAVNEKDYYCLWRYIDHFEEGLEIYGSSDIYHNEIKELPVATFLFGSSRINSNVY